MTYLGNSPEKSQEAHKGRWETNLVALLLRSTPEALATGALVSAATAASAAN